MVQSLTERLTMLWWHCDDKATGRLSIQQCIVAGDVRLTRHGAQVEVHAEATSKGHLSSSGAEASIGAVVAGADKTRLYSAGERFVQSASALRIHLGDPVADSPVQGIVLGAAELGTRFTEDKDEVTGLFHIHGDSITY